ncbi:MAG: hypothetical protein M3384_02860 [Acidobacteriota bacterium]|nr:hypothetical protein [Acidobacteriota bacterium]
MRVIFSLLIVFAALLSLLIFAIVVMRLNDGEFYILLPGPGLVINFAGIVAPLLIIDTLIIASAFLIWRFGLKRLS